jgi:hypothetical protein
VLGEFGDEGNFADAEAVAEAAEVSCGVRDDDGECDDDA